MPSLTDALSWLVLAALCLGLMLAVLVVASWTLMCWRFRDDWDRRSDRDHVVHPPSRPRAQAVGLGLAVLGVAFYLALD